MGRDVTLYVFDRQRNVIVYQHWIGGNQTAVDLGWDLDSKEDGWVPTPQAGLSSKPLKEEWDVLYLSEVGYSGAPERAWLEDVLTQYPLDELYAYLYGDCAFPLPRYTYTLTVDF